MEIYVYLNGAKKIIDKVKCRDIYRFLINKTMKPPTAVTKWAEVYNISEHEFETFFRLSFKRSIETDLQTFQYKIIHRFCPCNYTLYVWYSEISNMCQHCHKVDILVHYFVYSTNVELFWKLFEKRWKRNFEFWFVLSVVTLYLASKIKSVMEL